MKRVAVADFVKSVRITLDENQTENEYLATSTDNMELDEIIRAKAVDAVRSVVSEAPLWMVEGEDMDIQPSWIHDNQDGSGYIKLPDDFLRLVALKMSGWKIGVNQAVKEGTQKALQQTNPFVRGTPAKPVCVEGHDADGNLVLEFYSVPTGQTAMVEKALYVRNPAIVTVSGVDYIDIPYLLHTSSINHCAGLTELVRGNADAAKNFFEVSKSYFINTPA